MYRPFVVKLEELVRNLVEDQNAPYVCREVREEILHEKLERLAELIFKDYKDKLHD